MIMTVHSREFNELSRRIDRTARSQEQVFRLHAEYVRKLRIPTSVMVNSAVLTPVPSGVATLMGPLFASWGATARSSRPIGPRPLSR